MPVGAGETDQVGAVAGPEWPAFDVVLALGVMCAFGMTAYCFFFTQWFGTSLTPVTLRLTSRPPARLIW